MRRNLSTLLLAPLLVAWTGCRLEERAGVRRKSGRAAAPTKQAPRLSEQARFDGGGKCLAFSRDGKRFVAGSGASQFRIFKGQAIEHTVQTFDFGSQPLFGPGDRQLYFAPYIYDLSTRKRRKLPGSARSRRVSRCSGFSITASTFTPDVKQLVAFWRFWPSRCRSRRGRSRPSRPSRPSPKDRLEVQDVASGKLVALLTERFSYQAAITADARHIAAGDSTVLVWRRRDHQQVGELRHKNNVTNLRFSPDGKWLATVNQGGKVCLWRTHDWKQVCWKGHDGIADAVTWHPSGVLLATGGWDKQLRLWSVAERGPAKRVRGLSLPGAVEGLAFDRRGRRLLAFARGHDKHQLILYRVHWKGQ